MARFFMVLVVLGSVVAGVGFYRGWFQLTSGSAANNSNVTLTVDKDKIHQDKNDAQKKLQDLKQK